MELTIENIEKIVNQTILVGFEYAIKESESTSSIYLTIMFQGISRSVRFSDHMTNRRIKQCYIGKSTSEKKIERTIINMTKHIKSNIVVKLMDKIIK